MAFDREIMFVGSFNFDQRSLYINNEIGLLYKDGVTAGASKDSSGKESLRCVSQPRSCRPREP